MNKKYLISLIVVALFTTAAVSANTAFKKLTATERPDFKLVVNNDDVALKNNPVTINGVTYLPIREVATIFNQDVDFEKGTITLNSKSTKTDSKHDDQPKLNNPTEKKLSIGDEFELEGVTLKVNSVTYSKYISYGSSTRGGFTPNAGEKFVVINFDVLTSLEPIDKSTWAAVNFVRGITVNGKDLYGSNSTAESSYIKPNDKQTVEVFIPIADNLEVSMVTFYSPINPLVTKQVTVH